MIDYNRNPNLVTRRNFLKMAGLAAAGVAAGQMGLFKTVRSKHFSALSGDESPTTNGHLPGPWSDAIVPSLCEMCVWRCGLLAKVTDGRLVKLDGNPASSHSLGKLCARGQSGFMTTYDPDRVLFPLIRVGERGGGRFRRATWEEALDVTAEKMLAIKDQYGPEAMVFSSTHNLSQVQFENLLNGFGSPNYGTQRSLCFNAMVTAFLLTYGVEEPARNYANAEYILLTGRNLMEAISTSETFHLTEAIGRGAKLVVLDPRFTKTAAKAHEWIPIKPGTDLAFHLALIHVIVTEQLGDCDFVKQYTVGCEELPQAIKVAQHTQMATQNNPYLAQVTDDPRLWLNASVAAEKDIYTGDTVRVTSPIGSAEVEALVTQAIRPDCVYLTPGFGHRSKGLRTAYNWGVSDSDLHVTYTDPVSGGQALSQTFVTVEKIPA